MIGIGVVGYGYWGPNLARNFANHANCRLVGIADTRPDRLEAAARQYPSVFLTGDADELIRHPEVDAIAIAAPVSRHFHLALAALQQGKHIWVEKPVARSSEQAGILIETAAARSLVLMVDHTFIYTGAIRMIRQLLVDPGFGDIFYYDSIRVNLGIFQPDVNVLWDLAAHDLSIVDHLVAARPRAVSATGMNHFGGVENIAYLTLFFDGLLIAHIGVNWLAPVKVRQMMIGGSRRLIVYDDLEPSEKVKVYDRGVDVEASPENLREMRIGYRTGDMWAPKLATTEALRVAADHFLKCVEQGTRPLSDGESGLRVVRTLEAATESMQQQGRPIEIIDS